MKASLPAPMLFEIEEWGALGERKRIVQLPGEGKRWTVKADEVMVGDFGLGKNG